jgi:hypothetical protein
MGLGAGRDLVAQDRGRQAISEPGLDSIVRRMESMVPTSGPPGTGVTLRTGGMPALTPLRIGIGAVRFGFEEIGQVLTNERGEFSLAVTVPYWARRDLTHRFIVFDFYFVPIALSEVFHVTDADGMLFRAGTLASTGPPCPVLRGDDSVLYALAGELPAVRAGGRVVVEGKIAESSACPQRTTIEVIRITSGARE